MFELGDPRPEPFEWGSIKWESQEDYEEELAKFFGELACGADVPEAQVQYLAQRALSDPFQWGARVHAGDSSRVIMMIGDRLVQPANVRAGSWPRWSRLFATGVLEIDCPAAKQLPKEMRRQLELAGLTERLEALSLGPGALILGGGESGIG